MKGSVKKILIGAAALAVCGGVYYGVSRMNGGGTQVARAEAVLGPVKDTYSVTGYVTGGTESHVLAELSGSVKELCVARGERVEAGDVLLRLDPSGYEFQLEQARAQLSAYRAQASQADIARVMSASPSEYLTGVEDQLSVARTAAEEAQKVHAATQELFEMGAASEDELAQSRIALENADSALAQAEQRYNESAKIVSELAERGIGGEALNSEFYASERRQASAMATAQASVCEQLEDMIARCELKAPVSGVIRELPADGLNVLGAGQTVAVIAPEETEPLVEADVLTGIAPYLEPGDQAGIRLEFRGGSTEYTGRVEEVYDYAVEEISALGLKEYKVHIRIRPDDPAAFAALTGYSAQLTLMLFEEEEALSVPSSAVYEADGAHYIYTIENGTAVRKAVQTGYSSPSRTVILSGLNEGEEIIDKVENEGIYEGAAVRYEKQK